MKQYFCVGTYTEPILFGTGEVFQGKGEGLYVCSFEEGRIAVESVLPLRNPSFFCIHRRVRKLYAVNELKKFNGAFGGGVSQVAYDGSFSLTLEGSAGTGGTDPCHVVLSPGEELLVVSNFASGAVSVFPLDENGNLQERQLFQHEGHSVHPVRQTGPHAHSAIFAGQDAILVPDLGLDRLVGYRWKGDLVWADGQLTRSVTPGSGPRFGEFAPDGSRFYLINEIGSSVTGFDWDGEGLRQLDTVSTLPDGFEGDNICSDLHITADGAFLYASNRGHDSIAAFAIRSDGGLELLQRIACGGRTPRNFCLEPKGKYLLVGNQDSDTIVTFAIGSDGRLSQVETTPFPTPVCIRFF